MSRVAVLMGGWSAEREVSLSSGRGILAALHMLGHEAVEIDAPRDPAALLKMLTPKPDVVFNALHGRGGEDGHIQAMLDLIGVPYTHSGMLASALAMDKAVARDIFRAHGLPVAEGLVVTRDALMAGDVMSRPYVVKPKNEGSSFGIFFMRDGDNRAFTADDLQDEMLVERFIDGRELTVAIMGDRILPVIEIVSKSSWYDYESKYDIGGSEHLCPALIPAATTTQAGEIALAAHRALGCRGITRADLRYDDTQGKPGGLFLLEVNTQPGMTPTSLVPDAARAVGISYAELVSWMVENAACDR